MSNALSERHLLGGFGEGKSLAKVCGSIRETQFGPKSFLF